MVKVIKYSRPLRLTVLVEIVASPLRLTVLAEIVVITRKTLPG